MVTSHETTYITIKNHKHHHHGGGASWPSSSMDLINPSRLMARQPSSYFPRPLLKLISRINALKKKLVFFPICVIKIVLTHHWQWWPKWCQLQPIRYKLTLNIVKNNTIACFWFKWTIAWSLATNTSNQNGSSKKWLYLHHGPFWWPCRHIGAMGTAWLHAMFPGLKPEDLDATIGWLLTPYCPGGNQGHRENNYNEKYIKFAGYSNCHDNALVQYRLHCPKEGVQGFDRSHWLPTLDK